MSTVLVAYFSRVGNNYVNGKIVNLKVGNSEVAAKLAAKMTGADLFKIEPVKNYSADYRVCINEAQLELRSDARPELKALPPDLSAYKVIILCYPNWWGTMPMPVWTFLEKCDLKGKRILPLCTHEGSGMGHSEDDLKTLCPDSSLVAGLAIRGGEVNECHRDLEAWLRKARLDIKK